MGGITYVHLITGFLGSGKTTFLNHVIKAVPPEVKFMILMNEFGEVGIDGAIVEGEDLDILEISKGSIFCVCVKTDFIKGLNEIATKLKPDILLIESTGVANPSDLKRDLELPIFHGRFQLTEQYCIVDAVHFADAYETFSSVEKQIASSTLFIINKIDLATPEQIDGIKTLIERHHPDPQYFETTYARIPFERFFFKNFETGETDADADATPLSDEEVEAAIEALLSDPNREITPPDMLLSAVYVWSGNSIERFREIMAAIPAGVTRAKGYIKNEHDVYLFSLVMNQKELNPAQATKKNEHLINHLVFIASPDVMAELDALEKQFPELTQRGILNPMASYQ